MKTKYNKKYLARIKKAIDLDTARFACCKPIREITVACRNNSTFCKVMNQLYKNTDCKLVNDDWEQNTYEFILSYEGTPIFRFVILEEPLSWVWERYEYKCEYISEKGGYKEYDL